MALPLTLGSSLHIEGETDLILNARRENENCAFDSESVNAQDNLGNSAITYAAWKGLAHLTSRLLEAGADPTIANAFGTSALCAPVKAIQSLFSSHIPDHQPTKGTATKGEYLNALYTQRVLGNDIEITDELRAQLTDQIYQLSLPEEEIVQFDPFLQGLAGPNRACLARLAAAHDLVYVSLTQRRNRAALFWDSCFEASTFPDILSRAVKSPSTSRATNLIKQLAQLGIDLNCKTADGIPLIHHAIEHASPLVLRTLLFFDVDLSQMDAEGRTALDCLERKFTKPSYGKPDEVINFLKLLMLIRRGYMNLPQMENSSQKLDKMKSFLAPTFRAVLDLCLLNAEIKLSDESLIHQTARERESAKVNAAISLGSDINTQDPRGWGPVQHAIASGGIDVVQALIDEGASLDNPTIPLNTVSPLALAIFLGRESVVTKLMKSSAKVHEGSLIAPLPMTIVAAMLGSKSIFQELSPHINDIDALRGPTEQTLLMIAAQLGHSEVIEVLVERGANIDVQNEDGHFALGEAVRERQHETVQLLLRRGAQPNLKDLNGWTALHLAAEKGDTALISELIGAGVRIECPTLKQETPLHIAALHRHAEAIKQLIGIGAQLGAKTTEGNTPLHIACRIGDLEISKLLIESGSDRNEKNDSGRTPVEVAETEGHKELVNYLKS